MIRRMGSCRFVERVVILVLTVVLISVLYLSSSPNSPLLNSLELRRAKIKQILAEAGLEPDTISSRERSLNKTRSNNLARVPLPGAPVDRNASTWAIRSHRNSSGLLKKQGGKPDRGTLCPLWPSELVGPMQVSPDSTRQSVTDEKSIKRLEAGGRYRPHDCIPRENVAIIIPYRDRPGHLAVLLGHLHTVLQRQSLQYAIYVVEMAYPTQFNRGILANVGVLTASSINDYTCYVIHDVDLIMVDDRNIYRCGHVPRHLTAYNSKFKYSLPYLSYFGGVNAFTHNQFKLVNGFSNLYFGWGGEDDDMVSRIISTGMHFSRPKRTVGGFVALKHSKDAANPPNPHRMALRHTSVIRRGIEGVRTVAYTRLALEFKPLYTWVYISAKEADIMEKYREYLDDADNV